MLRETPGNSFLNALFYRPARRRPSAHAAAAAAKTQIFLLLLLHLTVVLQLTDVVVFHAAR
jgi:hypothetical protein